MIRAKHILAVAIACGAAPASADVPFPKSQCLPHPYTVADTAPQKQLRDLMAVLDLTVRGVPAMRQALDRRKPLICIDPRPVLPRGVLDTGEMFVALKSTLGFEEQHLILIHELRHLEQFDRGYCPSTTLSMQENARAVMATEADAMAITTLLAWDLKSIGHPGPWHTLRQWDHYEDIARRFEAELAAEGDLESAVVAAFDQWYASDWRVESYYIASCSDYLDRLDDSKLLPSYGLLPDDYLTRLCRLPDGAAYPCSDANRPK
jgi:hypothetical protein